MNPLLSDIRAVFFDAVGTLIVPVPPAVEVYAACATRHGLKTSPAEIGVRFHEAFRAEEQEDRDGNWACSEAGEERRWRNIVRRVFHDGGTAAQIESCFDDLFTHFAQPSAWRPIEQAGDVLAELASRGLVLGVASNFDRRLHAVVDGLPALAPLTHRVISSDVGRRKPDPRFFADVVRRARCDAGHVLFVGDSRENDYDGANAAGLRGVLLDDSSRGLPGVRRIRHLTDLL
jgi:putative hydrolase of the HAD superfamily